MQRGGRIGLAAGVLTAGMLGAMLFRHPQSAVPGPTQPNGPLLLRKEVIPRAGDLTDVRPSVRIESHAAQRSLANQPSMILLPMDSGQPPPELARTYPGVDPESDGLWERPGNEQGRAEGIAAARAGAHKIADGDTLAALAKRYLGAADRSWEIYQANRDLLSSPELLPIGAVLRIPCPASGAGAIQVPVPPRPLVPVPAGS